MKKVDPKKLSDKAAIFQWNLDDKIIGQERALKHLLRAYQIFSVKLNPPNRPILVLLFCGPTGVGKTECVKALAATLLGNEAAFTRIDCAEFQRSHEVSKLMGAPPSYLGYNDHGSVRLSQDAIDKFQTEGTKINIILFDEIEKAHPDFHQVLLGVLDNGKLRLGNGNETDFTKSIIVFTSNIGSHETAALINHAAIGFKGPQTDRDDLDQKIYTQTKEAAKKFFRPEFLNRIDHTIVFRSLSHASLKKILSIELRSFQKRLFAAGHRISVRVEPSARDFLLREGTSEEYGARELKRAVERFVTHPIASLLAGEQVKEDSRVIVSHHKGKELTFHTEDDAIVLIDKKDPPAVTKGSSKCQMN